jgi:hypothetical protein
VRSLLSSKVFSLSKTQRIQPGCQRVLRYGWPGGHSGAGEANAVVVVPDWGGLINWTLAAYYPKVARRPRSPPGRHGRPPVVAEDEPTSDHCPVVATFRLAGQDRQEEP